MISLRNSLSPVNRLPPEVLTACAAFVSDADPRPIVPLTHVCRYWRRSITSNPKSWVSISTGWGRLVPLCLERAGAAPLAVDIAIPDLKEDSSFLIALLPHVTRVAHLSLTQYSSTEAVKDDLPGIFTSPMPDLISLELQQTIEPNALFTSSKVQVPPVFQSVSKLKSLSLTRVVIYPPLFAIPSLVELKLIGYTNPSDFGTFIGFLASNPNLEIVVLDVRFVESSIWAVPAKTVSLARLRRLSITCAKPIDVKGLLSCIPLPRGTHLEVTCSQATSLGLCLPSPQTPIQKVLTSITVMKFQATPGEIHVFGVNGLCSFRSPQSIFLWNIELRPFPTTSVREIHMNVAPWSLTPQFLAPLFAQLPALETLVIANSLFWATGTFEPLAGRPPLCPSLKTIVFFNCRLTPEALKEFEGVVARRKGSAAAWLYRVIIVGSTEAPPDYARIQQLRQHVPCVDVRVDDKLPDLS